jgi:hypothetical protein
MPLPKVEVPQYSLTIPSTGKSIKFRPFLVKEEKILLLSHEDGNTSNILDTLKSIIEACTFNKIAVEDLAVSDIEYIFLKIRSKSVGETIDLKVKCQHCEHEIGHSFNIDNLKVVAPKLDTDIKITDKVGLKLKPIKLKAAMTLDETADFYDTILSVIDLIYDDNTVYAIADTPRDELIEFIESLPSKNLEKIQEYIINQPKLSHDIKFKCPSCSKDNSIKLEGLQSFLV